MPIRGEKVHRFRGRNSSLRAGGPEVPQVEFDVARAYRYLCRKLGAGPLNNLSCIRGKNGIGA